MFSNRFAVVSLATALTVIVAGAASAQNYAPYYNASIGATYYDTQLGVQDYFQSTPNGYNNPGAVSFTRTDFQVDAASVPLDGGTVQADILAAPPSNPGGYAIDLSAQSSAIYYFTVDGPVGQMVGVFGSAKGTISWSQGGIAHAGFSLTDINNGYSLMRDSITYNDPGNDELKGTSMFHDVQDLFLYGGETYAVSLNTYTLYHSNEYLGAPDGTFPYSEDHAVVDPTFTIDPNYAGSNLFTLDPDGGPLMSAPPSAPEPATWAMMIAGCGLLGAAMRRRRAVSATAEA